MSYSLPDIIGDNLTALGTKNLADLVRRGLQHGPLSPITFILEGTQLDGPWWLDPVCRLLQSLGRPFALPWVLTQYLTIEGQLMMGIRFFDLRISVGKNSQQQPEDETLAGFSSCCSWCLPLQRLQISGAASSNDDCKFYVTHGLPCVELTDVLHQLHSFLAAHSREVVVLRICADWDHRTCLGPEQGDQALLQVELALGDLLFDRGASTVTPAEGQVKLPTVAEMVDSGRPIALFVELPCSRNPSTCSNMFIATGISSFWANSPTPEGTVCGLVRAIQRERNEPDPKALRYAALAATPDVASISLGVAQSLLGLPSGLHPLAVKTNSLLPRLLDLDLGGTIMAITVDFPTEDVVRRIMGINLPKGEGPLHKDAERRSKG